MTILASTVALRHQMTVKFIQPSCGRLVFGQNSSLQAANLDSLLMEVSEHMLRVGRVSLCQQL